MPHRVTEFHNIQIISNLPSIMEHGILSYYLAAKHPHISIAKPDVQDMRDKKRVPGGLMLHHYANLYFDARNPMMYKRIKQRDDICVLKVAREVADLDDVAFSDQNAASPHYVRFYSPEEGFKKLDFDRIYAADWRHPNNPAAYYQHKSIKCAEILVPKFVPSKYIIGIYTYNEDKQNDILDLCPGIEVIIHPYLFFK